MSEYDGPERREGYAELAQRLDDHADEIAARFSRWFRGGLIVIVMIGLSSCTALIGFGYAIKEIQQQRKEACESQNARHDAAIVQLHEQTTARIKKRPEQTTRLLESQAVAINLIDALAPEQDCDETVQPPLESG